MPEPGSAPGIEVVGADWKRLVSTTLLFTDVITFVPPMTISSLSLAEASIPRDCRAEQTVAKFFFLFKEKSYTKTEGLRGTVFRIRMDPGFSPIRMDPVFFIADPDFKNPDLDPSVFYI